MRLYGAVQSGLVKFFQRRRRMDEEAAAAAAGVSGEAAAEAEDG